jgi:hypothetical protein
MLLTLIFGPSGVLRSILALTLEPEKKALVFGPIFL